jgi:hypothetical protein
MAAGLVVTRDEALRFQHWQGEIEAGLAQIVK